MADGERYEPEEVIARAAPDLRPEARGRALRAMAQTRPQAHTPRFRLLLTACGVALVLFTAVFVPYSATTAQAQMTAMTAAMQQQAAQSEPQGENPEAEYERVIAPYRARAAAFVEQHYANDSRMLLAAGTLTKDRATRTAVLKRAVALGNRAAWPAYLQALMEGVPTRHFREASIIQDPTLPNREQLLRDFLAQTGSTLDPLPEKEAAPILEAARTWAKAEPRNALPLVVETFYLYRMYKDREALARWQEAAHRPTVEFYYWEAMQAQVLLLTRMGMSDTESLTLALAHMGFPWNSGLLRESARTARYEGMKAEVENRPADALAWWNGAMALGRHMQESGRTAIAFMIGAAVEGIGASSVWKWYPGPSTGPPDGPLLRGRIFYGPRYAFYREHAGEAAATQVRERLVLSFARRMLWREYSKTHEAGDFSLERAVLLFRSAVGAVAMLLLFGLVHLGVSVFGRRAADEATQLARPARFLLALVSLLPAIVGWVLFWRQRVRMPGESYTVEYTSPIAYGLALTILAALLLPLVAARWSRCQGADISPAWRGNLRSALPVTALLCAVIALALTFAGWQMRRNWVTAFTSQSKDEMAPIIAHYGDRWTHPLIPPDAWRAEYPPAAESGGSR